jgi:hypothetical protein
MVAGNPRLVKSRIIAPARGSLTTGHLPAKARPDADKTLDGAPGGATCPQGRVKQTDWKRQPARRPSPCYGEDQAKPRALKTPRGGEGACPMIRNDEELSER